MKLEVYIDISKHVKRNNNTKPMKTSKKIVIITSRYPYFPGEEFLETEMEYWSEQDSLEVFIISARPPQDKMRNIPKNLLYIGCIGEKITFFERITMRIRVLTSLLFYKEIITQILLPLRFQRLSKAISSCINYYIYKKRLKKIITSYGLGESNTIFYTYWFFETTYALAELKKLFNYKIITRVHGGDLYEEANSYNYLPLRSQFKDKIDKIFTISDHGLAYCIYKNYPPISLEKSYLGIKEHNINTFPTPSNNQIHIVSCSYILYPKRIDKIIKAIFCLSYENNLLIKWSHIGSGDIADTIQKEAENFLRKRANVKFNFLGYLPNKEVFNFYKNNLIDVFITTSSTEGIPISIIEAMSCHIPIVASNVGGISELVQTGVNGILLSKDPSVFEIVTTLKRNINFFKTKKIRDNAHTTAIKFFNASRNYPDFINILHRL